MKEDVEASERQWTEHSSSQAGVKEKLYPFLSSGFLFCLLDDFK